MSSRPAALPPIERSRRLSIVFLLNLVLVAGLVAVGLAAHSFAVLAEGGDFLLDAVVVGLGVLAVRASQRREATEGRRLVDLATLANAGWLLALELLVAGASAERLATSTPRVRGLPVLVMSGMAAVVMIAAAFVLKDGELEEDEGEGEEAADPVGGSGSEPAGDPAGHRVSHRVSHRASQAAGDRAGDAAGDRRDLLVAAVLLDTLADAAAAGAVAATGAVILVAHGWYFLDPLVALAVAVVVAYQAAVLLRRQVATMTAARR